MWSGSVSFGLVNVPIAILGATRDRQIHFHQLDSKDLQPIEVHRYCSEEDVEVSYDDIAPGYEIEKDQYVMLSQEELEAVAPEKTRTIDIDEFVDLDEIDPIYFDHPYLLVPTGGEGASRAYELLSAVMEEEGRVALGRFVLRNKEYLAAIRPREGRLTLTTMAFADEIRPTDPIKELVGDAKAKKNEIDAAIDLIEAMATDWDPGKYEDRHRERMRKLIADKGEGRKIEAPDADDDETTTTEVPDLMAALEATLAKARGDKGDKKGGAKRDPDKRMSKDDLLERARELDIDGRSKMNKDELAEAIAAAE
jgi:DNA end-binding protein Ku